MRVLIAGSDEPQLEILQSFLWDHGHEAELASNGLECRTMLQAFSPEVLVLDHDLLWGGADGVLAHLCEDPDLMSVSVILVADEDVSQRTDARVARRLNRPFRLADLLAHINSTGRSTASSGGARFEMSTPFRSMSTRF